MIFGYVDMTVYFNEKKYQQLGFMHLKVDVMIFSKNESIFDFSRLRTTIYNWKNKRSLNSHERYLSFKKGLFSPSKLLEAPTIPLINNIRLKYIYSPNRQYFYIKTHFQSLKKSWLLVGSNYSL